MNLQATDAHPDATKSDERPAMTLLYESVAVVRVEKNSLGRRLVVRTCAGEVHSFEIPGPKGARHDRPELERAADFLQAHVKRTICH